MGLLGIKTYKDLCHELEIVKNRLEQLKQQKKLLKKQLRGPQHITAIDYSKDKGPAFAPRPLEDILLELQQIESMEFIEQEILNNMYKTIERVQENLEKCTGLHYKVAYMREVEGKKLADIAEELGYSLDYIKEISAQISKTINISTH